MAVSGETPLKLAHTSIRTTARANYMVHLPMSRPDPFDDSEIDEPLFALEHGPNHADIASVVSKLASHMDGANSTDLALDLVLNEIVEQARLATTATGAAIALFRNDEMVCRASSGASAPDLGTRLNTRTGLSGACLRTRQVQRCDDTQTDPRVDGAALRNLDVRSILVVPILSGEDLVGVFEILSPRPTAFGDREVLTLEALSRRIVRNLERIAVPATPPQPVAPALLVPVAPKVEVQAAPRNDRRSVVTTIPVASSPVRDHWTTLLTGVVISLALLLGWMVGYAGWQRATASRLSPVAVRVPADSTANTPRQSPPIGDALKEKPKTAASTARTKAVTDTPSPGSLVVYENGKVIFQMPPNDTAASSVKAAGGSNSSGAATLAPDVADTYLLRRVEPEYPEAAKSAQALGPVILEILVDKQGLVRQANLISGDQLLIPAAVAAVGQWKYQPYSPDGNPQEFLTRVTVNFKAP